MDDKSTCSLCGKPATCHVSYVSGKKVLSESFCADHAQILGILDGPAFDYIDAGAKNVLHVKPAVSEKSCPDCGMTLREFRKIGRLGCPTCYSTFDEVIQELLPRMHRGTEHVGKAPKGQMNDIILNNRIRNLQDVLAEAIRDERYEDAALTRDEMSELKAQLESED